MATPKVSTNTLNQGQGGAPEIERKVLFIGVGTGTQLQTINFITGDSDLDALFGEADSELKSNITAAIVEAGSGFNGAAIEVANFAEWPAALAIAMQTFSPEMVAVCTPISAAADLTAAQVQAQLQITTHERLVSILMTSPGILALQSWSEYVTTQTALTDGVAGNRVVCVPNLHGNNVGACVGRLANRSVSIADSIMRTQTGPVVALGTAPVDKDGLPLDLATLAALHAQRLTVPFWFTDIDGVFWTDCLTMDVTGGDYQVLENRRVIDKAARAIRILSVQQIANRQFNSTPTAEIFYTSYFASPLREMAQTQVVGGKEFPGDIKKLKKDAVSIHWVSKTQVKIYYTAQPYNSPKEITNNLMLDLSNN